MSHTPGNATSFGEGSVPDVSNQMGLAEILQMCCLSRRSGQIDFRSEGSSGFLYLLHGRVTHALCGSLQGEEAIYRMLTWPPGDYSLTEDVLSQDTTVILSWQQLLLEGARRADQGIDPAVSLDFQPVVTFAPATSTRVKANLPKITLTLPNQQAVIYELEAEYTHVGRAAGNEVPVADPSVSNRHCIFILQGADVVLRDLNSSNGTLVNGHPISEAILLPGDAIQIGVVQMKFEPAVRRPKLTQAIPSDSELTSTTGSIASSRPSRTTFKLPLAATSLATPPSPPADDSAFVKGEFAISYHNLPKPPEPRKTRPVVLIVIVGILVLALLGGAYFYFFVLRAR